MTIAGSCSFFALPRLNRVLHSVPEGQDVVVELNADYLDHAFREALVAWQKQQRNTGASVILEEHGTTAFSDAEDNTPQRQDPREFPLPPRTSWLPSGDGSTSEDDDGGRQPLRSILLGIDKYHRRHADKVRPLVQDLTEGRIRTRSLLPAWTPG